MVSTALVHIWGQLVGAVAWDADSKTARFEYDAGFDLKKYALAPIKMPEKGIIYSFPELADTETFKGLPGLLADSVPDRYGKELINIWLAQQGRPENSLNPVELLCFVGKRGMGALEFEPAQELKTHPEAIELSHLIDITKSILEEREKLLIHTSHEMKDVMINILKMGTSAGGARPKAIIAYNEETGEIRSGQTLADSGFEHWLIKFDAVSDVQFGSATGYGKIEMTYYKMATDFGIDMMESRLIEENDRVHFMTKRFDRENGNQKIHIQTFCAIQHYNFNNITSYSYEQLFQTMRRLRLDYSEAEQMYKRMVFNILAKNCDDHTKNFSFMMKQGAKWQLAPAYDVCFSYSPESYWVSQHNLSVNGKRKDFERKDLLEIAKQNNIRNPEKIIDEGVAIVNNWSQYAKDYDVDPKKIKAIDNLLLKRL